MDFDHNPRLSHFQLRNMLACTSRDQVFYSGRNTVTQASPLTKRKSIIMDLTDPVVQPVHAFPSGIQVSTLAAKHDIIIAGGFCGEYAMKHLHSSNSSRHTEGLVTEDLNSITNHISINLSRTSGLPVATLASNDRGLRALDCTTNQFISDIQFPFAINCTATSPDGRLRALVGDTTDVLICSADGGEILHELQGHGDFGFACAWADDGWHVATGNQDMRINIWDARYWKKPMETLAADTAGVRSLHYSPLGSGKRVLVAAEPSDLIHVIDAETYDNKQVLDFFGEISGVSFTPDGQNLFVANCDQMRGGLMQYSRTGFGEHYGLHPDDEGYDWLATDAEIVQHPKAMRTMEHRRRKIAFQFNELEAF
jgi:WD40 repeat protein